MRNVLRFLKSLHLSLALMSALLPVIAAGNLIPQQAKVSPAEMMEWQRSYPTVSKLVSAAGLDHVYTSWWFLIVFAILFLNMALITWDLIGVTRRKALGLHRYSSDAKAYFALGTFPHDDGTMASLNELLRKRRYHVLLAEGEVYARKGWPGIWGGTILHVGLVILLAGAVVSGLTRFNGFMEMGVGQSFSDTEGAYLASSHGPLFPGHHPERTIKVLDMEERDLGKMKALVSTIMVSEHDVTMRSKTVRMNDPLYYNGMKIFQSRHSGPALLFGIEDITNPAPTPVAGYVNLQQTGGKTSSIFTLKGTPFQARAEFLPGSEGINIEVRDRKEIVYQGPMRPGQALLVDNWKIRLAAINKWSGIIVVYDWAVPIIFAGFALVIAGIAVMGLFDPREIWARETVRDGVTFIEVLGWGRWRNMFLDEFNDMKGKVKEWQP